MSRTRLQTWLVLLVLAVGGVFVAIAGLFTYISVTARPLHPDPARVSAVTGASAPAWTDAIGQARTIARAALVDQNLPGLAVTVGVGGDLVWSEGLGWADLDAQTPVTPDTRFRIAEVSIPPTAVAVGLLLDRHAIDLDAEIQTYVPEYPKKAWPVTLRQLMANVSGVRTDAGDEEPLLERCERTVDGIRRFANDALLFQPGTRHRTSSYGWILVSAAVEAAARQPFPRFMRAEIFEPLQMADTRPEAASEQIPHRATFYFPRFAGDTKYGPESVREGDQSCFAGAGGYLSTPSDLVRFGLAIAGGKLLQPATLALLQTPQRLASGEDTGEGLGWAIGEVALAGQPARVVTRGSKPDFIGGTAYLLTVPDRGLVVAAASNISFADLKSVALHVAEPFARGVR